MDDSYNNEKFETDEIYNKINHDLDGDIAYGNTGIALEKEGDTAHKMRLSLDIHSIKEAIFKGLIYAKYSNVPTIGTNCINHH